MGGRARWEGGPRPACMMVNHSKVGLQSFMSHTKVKPNPRAEDKTCTSNYLNLEIGRRKGGRVFEKAHRLVCLAFHGFPSRLGHNNACHSCSHKGCVQGYHMSWQPQAANLAHRMELTKGLERERGEVHQ